jgi:PAS domain S-box-containing protein
MSRSKSGTVAAPQLLADPAPAADASILIVDDHEANLLALEAVLSPLGHRLVRASSGQQALRQILDHDFAVILLDVMMPGLDGFETAALIRNRERSRAIPIIFVSARSNAPSDILMGYSRGAVDYLVKPFDPDILRAKVEVFVELYRSRNEIARQAVALREREQERDRLERSLLLSQAAEAEQRRLGEITRKLAVEEAGRLAALEREDSIRQIVESISDPLVILDPAWRISYLNEEAATLLAQPRDALIGRDLWSVTPQVAGSRFHDELRRARREGVVTSFDEYFAAQDTWFEVKAYPTRDGRLSVQYRSINVRKRAEAALEVRAQELARSNAELERFAYVASHDLQEPLRMVASYTQLLGRRYKGKLDANADDFIGFAVDGANRMQALINDLLAFSRVTTQAKEPALISLELPLAAAIANLQAAIDAAAATVLRDPMPSLRVDQHQFLQLFQNLIGNALKFRGAVPSIVHVRARPEGADWVISVADNGIGISAEFFDRLFVLFQRLHTRTEYPGNGIGLAICKKIIERHGGRIWVESAPGRGTTFFFQLRGTE